MNQIGFTFRSFAQLLFLLLVSGLAQPAVGQLANRKDTLRDHQQVYVAIAMPETEEMIRELGLRKDSLERFILDRLKENHIAATSTYTNQTLVLEIRVDLHEVLQANDKKVYAFVSQFDALQAARLATNRQSALASTWRASQFGAVTRDQSNLLRDAVIQTLDQFIVDWKSAQQSEPASTFTSEPAVGK